MTYKSLLPLLCAVLLALVGRTSAQETPLPLEYSPTGVLFRVSAPQAREVYLAGTFNGWGGSDGHTVSDPLARMYGPDEKGVFEKFYPLTPGSHIFKFCIDGYKWIPGPPDLQRAKDNFDLTAGQQGMAGSTFEFSLTEPPWPSYVPTKDMMPVAVTHKETGEPYLRVRFFSRQAKTVHVVGSWDNWGGITDRAVNSEAHAAKAANVPHFYEKYVGPLKEGWVEYKIVVNNRQWLSDPSVAEQSDDGNSRVQIVRHNNQWMAFYNPRFDPNARRRATQSRWGNQINWLDDREDGFKRASATKTRMIWVITLPKSKLSEQLMTSLNSDPEAVEQLKTMVCLETVAHDVEDILRTRRIYRLPYVIMVDSNYKPVYEAFNPSLEEVKAKMKEIK